MSYCIILCVSNNAVTGNDIFTCNMKNSDALFWRFKVLRLIELVPIGYEQFLTLLYITTLTFINDYLLMIIIIYDIMGWFYDWV